MSMISILGGLLRPRVLAGLTGAAVALGLGALMIAPTPASADDYNAQGLQPPAYKYHSQYARKSGMYLNLGGIAYVRVPTIRLRTGAVKYRDVQYANNGGVGHFYSSVGHFRPGPAQYGKQQRIIVPVKTPYYYRPYGSGGPFYGQPSGYVANYYGMNGYGLPNGRLPKAQMGYGTYGFNTGQALQGLPNAQRQKAYVGSFNAPTRIVAVQQQRQLPAAKPRFLHFNGATVKSGNLPVVHKPAGKNLIRVE
jgi:hypothetical protein